MVMEEENTKITTTIFTYGTLKRGFPNHPLMEDLIRTGDAIFKGSYTTFLKYPLVCGPYKVPFLLNMPGYGHHVAGELYAVSKKGLERIDELEGTCKGHYRRLPIQLRTEEGEIGVTVSVSADAYFAERSYDEALWKKNGMIGFSCYSGKEAKGYVWRKDRPQDLTFLDHIRVFLCSDDNDGCCNQIQN